MRLTLWLVPTIAFIAVAVLIVQHESPDVPTATPAAAALPPTEPLEIAGELAEHNPFVFNDEDDRPITSPPSGGPEPIWRIVDLGLSASVLSSSDVPTLAISNSMPVRETEALEVAAADKKPAASPWEVVGQSTQGRPIHIRRYGNQGDATLIVCGLDGEDRIAVKWIDSLSLQLADAPEQAKGRQIILLRDPNPDGLTRKATPNDRGVNLNRNFPTPTYQPGDVAGPGPASEPETRAMLEVLYRFQPKRVIHLQSAGRSEVAANEAAQELADMLQDSRQMAMQDIASVQNPGSLEEFAGTVLKAEVMTLRLATGDDWRSAAIGHYPTLMAAAVPAIAEESLSVARTSRIVAEDAADSTPSPFSASTEITRLERRGYEELPPPPHRPSW